MIDPASVRAHLLAWRRALPPEEVARRSALAQERLLAHPAWAAASTVTLYVALSGEVDTRLLWAAARKNEKRVALPRVDDDRADLTFYFVEEDAALVRSRFGILEPKATAAVAELESIDLFVVPGVAFDRRGGRIGMGRGYYDRVLRRAGARAFRAGIAFEDQVVEVLPQTERDESVHAVFTETKVHRAERAPLP